MQTAINFAACAIDADKDKTPVWKKILRVMLLRQLDRLPWISIMELREVTHCQSVDMRIRELRKRLDREITDMEKVDAGCLFMIERATNRNISSMVNMDDIIGFPGQKAQTKSSIATFRIKYGEGWLWVYMLNLNEIEVKRIVGDVWA